MPHPPFLDTLDSDPEEAWRAFVSEQSGLVLATLERYLPDPDLRMDGYLAVLESLRADGFRRLHRFVERAREEPVPFAAWLKLVSRNAALDLLRRRAGRRAEPEVVSRRDSTDRLLFRCLYWDRSTYAEALEEARAQGKPQMRIEEIVERADALHAALSRAGFHLARSRGPSGARAVSFDDADAAPALEAEATAAVAAAGHSIPLPPDLIFEQARSERGLADLLLELSENDRALVMLRYGEGLQAAEIAPLIGAGTAKAVYRRLDRLLERLREKLGADSAPSRRVPSPATGAPRPAVSSGENEGSTPSW